jgi:very-short-patch-repair endonuclease
LGWLLGNWGRAAPRREQRSAWANPDATGSAPCDDEDDGVGGSKRDGQGEPPPYESQRWMVSRAERSFLGVLEEAVEGRFRIALKVRLADVLKVRSGSGSRGAWQNRILQKHLDFVLCTPDTLEIVAGVELDDSSHDRASRRERDDFLDAAMAAAGVPLIRVKAARSYSVGELRELIERTTEPPRTAPPPMVRRGGVRPEGEAGEGGRD